MYAQYSLSSHLKYAARFQSSLVKMSRTRVLRSEAKGSRSRSANQTIKDFIDTMSGMEDMTDHERLGIAI